MKLSCIFNVFPKKYTCEICGEKLSKKFFANDSSKKICIRCQIKENEKKKKKESDKNFQYIHKNCKELFVTHSVAYVTQTSVWFDVSKGEPCLVQNDAFGPRGSLLYWSYSYISFEELKDLAKRVSNDVFEKYKDIDVSNWKQFI